MNGDWLTRALRGLLHEDTFELFLSPAIADLQHAPTLVGYLSVWTSLAGALAEDLAGDLDFLTNDLALLLGLITIQVCYYGGILLLLVADVRLDEAIDRLAHGEGLQLMAMVAGVIGASAVPTVLCFWPPRRSLSA